jgi:hypothetical protein
MAYKKRRGDGLLFEIGYTDDFGHDHTTAYGFSGDPPQAFLDSQEQAANRPRVRRITPGLKMKVLERDDFTCKHCKARKNLTVDHILAVANGGTDDFDNLQTLCMSCNLAKGTK